MKKKLLAAAIGAAMATGATVSQAESLLFPYFQSGNGAWSFIELATVNNAFASQRIHYIWNNDDMTTDAVECEHGDLDGTMTAWDLVQHTVATPAASGIDLVTDFGDTSSAPAYNLHASPTRGFMIVSNQENGDVDLDGNVNEDIGESTFNGAMIVVDSATGQITSYRGRNNPGQFTRATEGNWNNILTSHPTYDLTWYPDAIVNTVWYTLVTGVNMDNVNNWAGAGILFNGFGNVFNRNEVPYSGNRDVPIVCHAFLSRSDLMTGAQYSWSTMGGYMWAVFAVRPNGLSTVAGTPVDATGILMTKIMTTAELGGVATAQAENAWPNLPY